MAKKRGRGRRSFRSIAEANAELRYAPEASALQALLGQAHQDYRTDVRSANALARTTIQGARGSRPLLKQIYHQAARGVKVAQRDIDTAFNQAGVTPDNAFKLASDAEGTAYRQRMTAEAANARRETVRNVRDAQLGRFFALGAAKDQYNQSRSQLNQRATDLLGERQTFVLSELGRMQDAAANRRNQRKVALIQQGIDPKTGKPIPGGKADKGGEFAPASRSDRKLFSTALARALDLAPDYAKTNISRSAAAKELRAGVAASGKGRSRDPGFRAIPDQLAVQVALDMAYRGSVSAGTRRALLQRGFRPDQLGGGVRFIHNRKRRQTESGRRGAQRPGSQIPVVGGILGLGI